MNTNREMKQVGKRLQSLRLQAGLTTENVASLLSTSHDRYIKIENGEVQSEKDEISIEETLMLCSHYGITLDNLLSTGVKKNLNLDDFSDEQIKTITDLNERFSEILSE